MRSLRSGFIPSSASCVWRHLAGPGCFFIGRLLTIARDGKNRETAVFCASGRALWGKVQLISVDV